MPLPEDGPRRPPALRRSQHVSCRHLKGNGGDDDSRLASQERVEAGERCVVDGVMVAPDVRGDEDQ
jgi:hypothetical protein